MPKNSKKYHSWLFVYLASKLIEIAKSPETLVSVIGFILVGILLAVLLSTHLNAAFTHTFFTPISVIEETAYIYTSANNFIEYGYWQSGFLQDMANSSDPADHPYIYNHMPPGPDIFLSLLLQLSGRSYAFTRVVYALIFIAGVVIYLWFVALIFKRFRLIGAGYTILFVGAWALVLGMDRQVSNPFLLLGFLPFIALHLYYQTNRRRYLYFCIIIGLISSLYLEVHVVVGLVSAWFFLYLTQLIRVDFKHLLFFVGTVAFGIVLHLLQNLLYLGPSLFVQELTLLLSNRIFGYPSPEAMKAFYESVGIVHHGARPLNSEALISQILGNLTFPGYEFVALTLVLSLLLAGYILYNRKRKSFEWFIGKETPIAISYFARLTLWIVGSVLAPLILFPAFAQEFNLRHSSRIHYYFLVIGIVAVLAYGFRQILQQMPWSTANIGYTGNNNIVAEGSKNDTEFEVSHSLKRVNLPGPTIFIRFVLWMGLIASALISINKLATTSLQELESVRSVYRSNWNVPLEEITQFSGYLYMTNINIPAVGFLTHSPGYGVCGLEAISENGSINTKACKVAFMRQLDFHATQRPKYFFFFSQPAFFPGFADCLPGTILPQGEECVPVMRQRLASNFVRVFTNETFEVYDLHTELKLQPIHLEVINLDTTDIQTKINAKFDDQLSLLGYDLFFDLNNAKGEGIFLLSLYWRSQIDLEENKTLLVTMRDANTNRILNEWAVSLSDADTRSMWRSGQVINTTYQLDAGGLMKGRYNLDLRILSNESNLSDEPNNKTYQTITIKNIQDKIMLRLVNR
jgi:hypothetical protein